MLTESRLPGCRRASGDMAGSAHSGGHARRYPGQGPGSWHSLPVDGTGWTSVDNQRFCRIETL